VKWLKVKSLISNPSITHKKKIKEEGRGEGRNGRKKKGSRKGYTELWKLLKMQVIWLYRISRSKVKKNTADRSNGRSRGVEM
jgi:hypothetical protein